MRNEEDKENLYFFIKALVTLLRRPKQALRNASAIASTPVGLWCGSNAFRVLQPASAGRMREKRYKNYPEISHIKLKQSVSTEPQ